MRHHIIMKKKILLPLAIALAFAAGYVANGPFAQSASVQSDANIYVALAKKVVPSVVNISTLSSVRPAPGQGRGSPDDMFRKFFEDMFRGQGQGRGNPFGGGSRGGDEEEEGASPKGPKAASLGTGFIIEPGLILTNNHVVAGADEIKISFTEDEDEKPTDGEVVGRDPELDVALIKVTSTRDMKPLVFGDSDALEVGEYVAAVGNPFGQGHSVTHGIISAKGRIAPDFRLANYLQTDAPINPGNSGGPLVNLKGEVIGINNAIDQRAQGIGFAIPIQLVKGVLAQLKTKGMVSRGYIGVLVGELTPEVAAKFKVKKDLRAPFVTQVYPGEPADKAGIKNYDVITEINGKTIKNSQDLINAVVATNVGDTVPIKVLRDGKELSLHIKIAQRPSSQGERVEESKPKKSEKKKPKVETGMEIEDMSPEIARDLGVSEKTKGAFVTEVEYGSVADQAGLARGDIIVEVDQKAVTSADSFYAKIAKGKSFLLRVKRADAQGKESYAVILLDLKN